MKITKPLGVSIDQLIDLNLHVTSMRNTKERPVRNAIGIYLFKMKCGLSNALIATLFSSSEPKKFVQTKTPRGQEGTLTGVQSL